MRIKIDQLAKMEGHLDFVGHILNGDVAKAKIETTEGVRLIESILVDRKFYDAPIITDRSITFLNLRSNSEKPFIIRPGEHVGIPVGQSIEKSAGYYMIIHP